ncbi:MAG: shikimate dehydrogenase family protein, partial [Thermacetogeniaceae bacterium]
TVVNRDGHLVGYNTDASGFLESLRYDAGFEPRGSRAVILGAGGAARAVAFALVSAGVESLGIFNRSRCRAELLGQELSGLAACEVVTGDLQGVALWQALGESELLVNATSAGMYPHLDELPLRDPSLLRPGLLVYDLVYNPLKTRLLQEAEKRGCRICSGLGMLVYQGALAFELWTGRRAPVAVMRQAAEEALKNT